MTVCTRVSVPAADFLLPLALSDRSADTAEIERSVPLSRTFSPYLWWSGDDHDRIHALLEQDPTVQSVIGIEPMVNGSLVGVHWCDEQIGFLQSLSACPVTLLRGIGHAGTWSLQLRFEQRSDLSACYDQWQERSLDVTVEYVTNGLHPGVHDSLPLLTQCQRETLSTAFRSGYFDVPRRVTLQELAAELGVSDTAVSQRIRRGVRSLVELEVV